MQTCAAIKKNRPVSQRAIKGLAALVSAFLIVSSTMASVVPDTLYLPTYPNTTNASAPQINQSASKTFAQRFVTTNPAINPPVDSIVYSKHGTPRQLKTTFQAKTSLAKSLTGDSRLKMAAKEFLIEYKNLLLISNPEQELTLQDIRHDSLGRQYLRYTQHYQGIPIWPSELTVQINEHGQIDLLNGYYIPSPRTAQLTPIIEQANAIETAQFAINSSANIKSAHLVLYSPLNHSPRLAWQINFKANLTDSWQVFVDALYGSVLNKINQVNFLASTGSGNDASSPSAVNRDLNLWQLPDNRYYMVDTSKTSMFIPPTSTPATFNDLRGLQGAIVVEDAQGRTTLDTTPVSSLDANNWADPTAVSAAYALSEAYDYFYTRHNVTRLVGENESINAVINFGIGYDGSFWQPDLKIMVLGNAQNYAASLDIVAHELSHALNYKTARLIYENQSGALNEAFADIFGEAAEASSLGVTDWLMGSQLNKPTRNLANPASINIPTTTRPYPNSMAQYIDSDDPFLDGFPNRDYGGVHFNNTIISHAFYILASSTNIFDAEKIFYHTLAFQLTRYSQFIDARLGAIASAEKIFGKNSPQVLATANAFTSVGIFDADPSQPGNPTPQVDNSDSTLFITPSNNLNSQEPNNLIVPAPPVSTQLARPSVSGDGSLAAYLDGSNNVCWIATLDLTDPGCLSPTVNANAIALSPNKKKIAYVLNASPTTINIYDISSSTTSTLNITAPTTDNATLLTTIKRVDQMDFSSDSNSIYFNASNEITYLDGNTTLSWSIYSINITSQQIYSVIPSIKGISFSYPALGNTRDNLLTFTGYDGVTDKTFIFAADLNIGIAKKITEIANQIDATPSFNGNDSAIIYSHAGNLYRQNISTVDHTTASGSPTLWQANAQFGVVYRRGTFLGPNLAPEGTIETLKIDSTALIATNGLYEIKLDDEVVFEASAIDIDSEGVELINPEIQYEWIVYDNSGKIINKVLGVTSPSIPFTSRGDFVVRLIATDSFGASDPTPASVTVSVGSNNIPPNSIIEVPSNSEVTIAAGGTLSFVGSGSDVDGIIEEGATLPPLTYLWGFSGIDDNGDAIDDVPSPASVKDPGDVTFNVTGVYTITLTVSDILSEADPSPAQVTINVVVDPDKNQPIFNDSKPPSDGGGQLSLFLLMLLLIQTAYQRKIGKILAQASPSP